MIKKLASLAIGAGLILASVAPVFAAAINIRNTGQGSTVGARVDRVKSHVLTLTNTYTLNHTAASNQSTGNNKADNNTGEGLAAAGNVTGNVTSQVEANTSNVDIDLSEVNETCNCVDNVTVDTTGQDSDVDVTVNSSKNVVAAVGNSGTVNNVFTSVVNTGNNSSNNNTGNGTAVGGEASVWHTITTKLNAVMYKIKM